MTTLIQLRRDTAANWASVNPTLAAGELGLVTDTGRYKIGDGVRAWNALPAAELAPAVTTLDMPRIDTPSPAATGRLTVFAQNVGGRSMLAMVGSSGIDTAFQPMLARNKIGAWIPPGSAATVPGVFGYTPHTIVGTATTRSVTTTNLFTRMRRLGYVSAATAGSFAAARVAIQQITTGTGTIGGFLKVIRFGISDAAPVAGARMFVGIAASVAAPTNVEPATWTQCIGIGHGASDTNLKLYYGGSAAQTPIDLGANFPANTANTDVYELALFASPTTGDVSYQVTRLNTGDVATGTLTSSGGVALPAPTTLLTYLQAWRCNNATALAVGLDIMGDYIETDT